MQERSPDCSINRDGVNAGAARGSRGRRASIRPRPTHRCAAGRPRSAARTKDHFVGSDQMVEIGNGDQRAEDHFVEATDMIETGKGGRRVELFEVQVPGINRHLKNIFDAGELVEDSVLSIWETTAAAEKTTRRAPATSSSRTQTRPRRSSRRVSRWQPTPPRPAPPRRGPAKAAWSPLRWSPLRRRRRGTERRCPLGW